WSHSYDIYIKACSGNIILHGPTGRRDIYYAQSNGTWAARGFFREIQQNPDSSFTMVFRDKGEWKFNSLYSLNAPGKIITMTDRNGNEMSFDYDASGRLVTIHTTLDDTSHSKDITIAYNADGLIESVTDYTGRQVKYEYYGDGDSKGSAGDLKSVTTPAVIGTPTGNDFPAGKKTVYTYTKGFVHERRNHNLLTITDPNGKTYLRNFYFVTDDPNDGNFDRVRRQILGEPNDIIDIRYRRCPPRPGNNYAVTVAIINDRAGNVRHYWFDQHNRLVVLRQYTGFAPDPDQYTDLTRNRPTGKLRPDDPDYFETRYQYNEDHLPVRVDYPNGNFTVNVYQGPNTPPRSRGNLREIHRFPGPLAPISDQNEIKAEFFYDTDSDPCGFNVVVRSVNPRGDERLYDYDDRGNRTRTTYKRQGPKPDIEVNYEYDERGRRTSKDNPDNGSGTRRRDEYTYYKDANDPNYGYLKNIIIDSNNLALTTTYAYDPFGNAIRVTDPNGNDMHLIRNQYGQVVKQISRQVSSGLRYETDFHYDIKDNVVHVARQNKDEEGTLQANSFFDVFVEIDIFNNPTRLIREVDPNHSIVTEYEYDDNYRRTLTLFGEATNGNQPNNNVRTIYDERGLVFRTTLAEGDPCQSTTQYDYNLNGGLKRTIQGLEGLPRITTHLHDGFNRRIETQDAMGNVSKFSYDDAGNLVSARRYGELLDVEGSAGNVRLFESKYRYDDLNRLFDTEILFFDPNTQMPIGDGNSVKQLFYSDNGLLTRTIDDNGNPTRNVYDTAGRLSTTIDAKYNRRIYQYDKNSNIIKLIEVDKSDVDDSNETFITNFVCDGLGRFIKRIDPVGNTTRYGYDSRGRCTLVTDALNIQSRYEYDGVGRLIRTVRDMDGDGADPNDANDIVTQYAYDDSGRLISITDDNGNTTGYVYDAVNRMTDILFADGTENTFSYNVHGNPVQSVDGDGDLDVLIYDKLGRLTRKNIIPGPETANTTTFEEYKYDGGSRLVYAENDSSIVKCRYDSHSNLVEEILNAQKTSYTRDGMGNTLSLTYPGGRVINSVPDELNRTSILGDGLGNDLVVNKYIGPRRLAQVDYRNGTRTIYHYDGMAERPNPLGDFGVKQIIKTTHVRVADGNTIDERIYAWNPVGSRKMQKDIRPGGPQLTYDYLYDPARRLIQTTVTDGNSTVVRRTSYDLDGDGNRKEVIGSPDSGPWVGTYFMDPILPEPGDFQMSQYTDTPSDSRQYSKSGNLTVIDNDDPGFNGIKYDYSNRMVEYTDGTTGKRHTYSYDPLGRRISKTIDADGIDDGPFETLYLYSGGQVIEERDGGDTTQATYVMAETQLGLHDSPGDDQFIMTRGGQDYYYHGDDSGSTRVLTDENGDSIERYRYHEYGSARIFNGAGQPLSASAIGNPYMFQGRYDLLGESPGDQLYDPETGFYNSGSRYLDPIAGRPTTRTGVSTGRCGGFFDDYLTAFANNPGRGYWNDRDISSSYYDGAGWLDESFRRDISGENHFDQAQQTIAKLIEGGILRGQFEVARTNSFFSGLGWIRSGGQSPLEEEYDFGDHVVNGGQSPISGIGKTVTIPILSVAQGASAFVLRPAPDTGLDRGQSLSGSRGNNVWLFGGGGSGFLDDGITFSGGQGLDIVVWTNGGQSLSASRGDDVWLFGGGGGNIKSADGTTINLGDVSVTRQLSGIGTLPGDSLLWVGWLGNWDTYGIVRVDGGQSLSGSRGDDVWLFGGGIGLNIWGSVGTHLVPSTSNKPAGIEGTTVAPPHVFSGTGIGSAPPTDFLGLTPADGYGIYGAPSGCY
nr:RHS repeat protein [Phycisphaerae bacterium]NIW98093.1 hypothetical protein [Phycisphaerae bacterium]